MQLYEVNTFKFYVQTRDRRGLVPNDRATSESNPK